MNFKIVTQEKKLIVILNERNEKDSRVLSNTDKPEKLSEVLENVTNLGKVTRDIASYNTEVLNKKLKFYTVGSTFTAELKFIRKHETPEPYNPLT